MLQNIGVLRSIRSEYGKQIRKQYESGELKVSRHTFLEKEVRNDGITNTLDTVQKDNWLAVKVKEATKIGYSIARGGARCRQLYNAGEQDKKRKSGGRYGEHIRHKLQSGNICSDFREPYCVCSMVSEKRMLSAARVD